MWDILVGLFDGKYKQYRRQSHNLYQLIKTKIIISEAEKKGLTVRLGQGPACITFIKSPQVKKERRGI
jgi:hypothetical protein